MTSPPEFVILGAMKAATTSLISWLCDYDEVATPVRKEPNYFCDEREWAEGWHHYVENFPRKGEQISGEASVAYLDPANAEVVADRLSEHLPGARLIAVIREPGQRLRSHYRHEVRMGRERRLFEDAITPDSAYVRRSLYGEALEHFWRRQGTNPLLVVRSEDLVSPDSSAWGQVTDFLGLPPRDHPDRVENRTSSGVQYTRLVRRLLDSPFSSILLALPRPVRTFFRPLLFRDGWQSKDRYTTTHDLPDEVLEQFAQDGKKLSQLIGWPLPIWPSTGPNTVTTDSDG